jgi:Tol biopolymer transport system component
MENLNLDIWVYDVARGSRTRLSVNQDVEILPVWSPDSAQVAFGSYRAGNTDIFVRGADASGEELVLAQDLQPERVSDWSRDGQYILYSVADSNDGHDLWYMRRKSKDGWEHQPLLQTSFSERTPKLSPDGRYVAYLSDESGRDEVYVRPFPKGDRKWTVSTNGASQLRWRRDGRELFFGERGTLVAVPVRTDPEFFVGTAVRLFAHGALTLPSIDANYDISADGERVLLPERVGEAGRERVVHVVQNWFAEFRDQQQ